MVAAPSCFDLMSTAPSPTAARRWCDALQQKLMDSIDAAWAMADGTDDPAVIAKARDQSRLAGHIAGMARKVLALDPPQPKPSSLPSAINEAFDRLDAAAPILAAAARKEAAETGKPPAAQAVAMREALRKLKRR